MLYTFRCECLHKFDELFTVAERPDALPCPKCGKQAKRIISISTVDTESECPDWIRSITDVVDPSDGRVHREFCANPTRENYRKFMSETGLRHVEPGERISRPEFDKGKVKKEMLESMKRRNTIYLGG